MNFPSCTSHSVHQCFFFYLAEVPTSSGYTTPVSSSALPNARQTKRRKRAKSLRKGSRRSVRQKQQKASVITLEDSLSLMSEDTLNTIMDSLANDGVDFAFSDFSSCLF